MKLDIKKRDYNNVENEKGEKRAVMNIIARDDNGERYNIQNRQVEPYFYIETKRFDDDMKYDDKVVDYEHGYESIRGKELTKVITRIPGDVPKLRGNEGHYEADILFPNRFTIDTGIYGGIEVPDEYMDQDKPEVPLSDIEKIEHDNKSRILYCDIEVDDEDGFPDETEGNKEIVCLTFYDSFTDEYYTYLYHPDNPDVNPDARFVNEVNVEVFDNEVDMLSAFSDYLMSNKPDIMAGWNFKKFDAMYLISRFDELDGLSKSDLSHLGSAYNDGWYGGKIKGIAVFDMLKAYKNLSFTELDSFGLDDVAKEELDIGKLEKEEMKIHEMWGEHFDTLLEYNIRDVYLTVALEESEDIIKFYKEVEKYVGGRLAEVVDFSKAVDLYILQKVNGEHILPSSRTIDSVDEEFEGAEVFDPASEIKSNISVLDLRSLYPFSMKTLNAGPTTKDPNGEITAPNGVSFTTDKKSVISDLIDSLLEEREQKKDARDEHQPGTSEYEKYDTQQTAVKIIMNSLYGVLGWSRFRLYDRKVGAAVTATGREVIKFTQSIASERGYDVVYGDTDSVMLEIADADNLRQIIDTSFELEDEINKKYDEFAKEKLNADEHWFDIEFEKVYLTFLQAGKKKRYAGHIVWKEGIETDKIDIVGFEFQRSDYGELPRQLQKQIIEELLMGGDREEVADIINNTLDSLKSLEYVLDNLGIPGGISQSFDQYTNKTKQVRGSEYANENFGEQIQAGDKPKGIYVEKIIDYPTPPQVAGTGYICWMNPASVPDETVFDWDKYIDIQIKNPISRILEGTSYTWDEIVSGQVQSGITGFSESSSDNTDDMQVEADLTTSRKIEPSSTSKETQTNTTADYTDYGDTADTDDISIVNEEMMEVEEEDETKTYDNTEEEDDDEYESIEIADLDDDDLENETKQETTQKKQDQKGLTDF